MATLSAEDYAALGDALTAIAAAVDAYLDTHDVPEPDYGTLNRLQTNCTALGAKWEQKAARVDYDDATAAADTLDKATRAIDATTARIKRQVADISKIAGVIGSVADLASALAAGAAGPILTAAEHVAAGAH